MTERSDTDQASGLGWFGFDRLRLGDEDRAVEVTIASADQWDRTHLRRLRKSGDLPGMVPVIDSDFSADGRPFAVTPVVDAPTLAELLDEGELDWRESAGVVEAVASALHETHLRGLFHGALTADDVLVIDNDVAVAGVGLGHGGTPPPERRHQTAPEVRDGAAPSEQSDVYSLGRLLETALGDSLDSAPRSIRRLIMWSTSDTPEARPPSAAEFATILAEGLDDDRARFGPAFIPTGDVTDLATVAGAVVAGETAPGDVATRAASLGAAAAAAADAFLAEADGGDEDEDDTAADGVADESADTVSVLLTPEDEGGDEDELVAAAAVTTEVAPAVLVDAASAGDGGDTSTGAVVPATTTSPVALDRTPAAERGRSRPVGLAIAALVVIGLIGAAFALRGGDDGSGEQATDSTASAGADGSEMVAGGGSTGDEATDASNDLEPVDGADQIEGDDDTAAAAPSTDTTGAAAEPADGDTDEAAAAAAPDATTTDGSAAEDPADTTTDDTTAPQPADDSTAAAEPADDSGEGSGGGAMAGAADAPIGQAEVITGTVASEDAALQLINGMPGDRLDVYLDGQVVATDLGTGMIVGPVDLPPGSHDVALFAADPAAPATTTERTDAPLAAAGFDVADGPESVFGHLDASGEPTLSVFAEPMDTLDPGTTRILVRNLMEGAAATVRIAGQEITSLDPGAETAVDLAAGSALVELLGDDGAVLASTTLVLDDGELASLAAIGTPAEGTGDLVVQRFSGLSSAPTAVPTGNSGLLDDGSGTDGLRVVYAMMASLAVCGGGILLARRVRSASR